MNEHEIKHVEQCLKNLTEATKRMRNNGYEVHFGIFEDQDPEWSRITIGIGKNGKYIYTNISTEDAIEAMKLKGEDE